MSPIEEFKEEKQAQHDSIRIRNERWRVRKMEVIFGLFGSVLLLFLLLSLLLNR
jgi:hypothetical protein